MNNLPQTGSGRPLSVTLIATLYLAAGIVGLTYHVSELDLAHPLANDALWICLVRLLAVVAGIFLLRGRNWARWLAVAWMAWHVALSLSHPVSELVMHGVLLLVFAWLLFRPMSTAWFRRAGSRAASKDSSELRI